MQQISGFKKGDTFSLSCIYKIDGSAVPINDYQIASQIRSSNGSLIQDLTVTKQQTVGQFTLVASSQDTSIWPTSVLKCDIQFSENGVVRSTETFNILVIGEVTK